MDVEKASQWEMLSLDSEANEKYILIVWSLIILDFTFVAPISIFGEGNGNPLQYSCLENPMERGAW